MGIENDFGDFAEAMAAAAAGYGTHAPVSHAGGGEFTSQAMADQQAASAAAEQAVQDTQVQNLVDQLSSIGYDVGGRRSAAAAAGWDPTGTYGGKGYQEDWTSDREGFVNPQASVYSQITPAIEELLSYYSQRPGPPAGRTDSPSMPYSELSDVFGTPNQTTLADYDPSVFDVGPEADQQAASQAARDAVAATPPSTLTGREDDLAALRTMGYTPEMAAGWPAARNTAGDIVGGILQGIIPFSGAAEIASPETTKGFRSGIAEGINDLFGTHAPSRNPWDESISDEEFSNMVSDIPATTSGFRGSTVSDLDPDSWESGGNVEAIRRFLQDPNYGNIPEIDPVSALAAYQNAIGGIDALVGERGFTGQGYAQAARDRTQGIFDKFLPGQDVDALLNEKIGRAFAEEALTAKGSEFRQQGVQAIEQSFPEGFASDIFNPEAFSKAAENIYGQKLGGAQDIIARAGSRGQLSPRGGRLASESLLSQGPDVRSGISDVISGIRSGLEGGLQGIRGSALEQAQGYQLGDELFDVTPFETQATDYLKSSLPGIESDISGAIGTDPLFSAVSALQEGGRQQGQVSGTPSFLDVLAEREGGIGAGRDRRGLGSRGSGVF